MGQMGAAASAAGKVGDHVVGCIVQDLYKTVTRSKTFRPADGRDPVGLTGPDNTTVTKPFGKNGKQKVFLGPDGSKVTVTQREVDGRLEQEQEYRDGEFVVTDRAYCLDKSGNTRVVRTEDSGGRSFTGLVSQRKNSAGGQTTTLRSADLDVLTASWPGTIMNSLSFDGDEGPDILGGGNILIMNPKTENGCRVAKQYFHGHVPQDVLDKLQPGDQVVVYQPETMIAGINVPQPAEYAVIRGDPPQVVDQSAGFNPSVLNDNPEKDHPAVSGLQHSLRGEPPDRTPVITDLSGSTQESRDYFQRKHDDEEAIIRDLDRREKTLQDAVTDRDEKRRQVDERASKLADTSTAKRGMYAEEEERTREAGALEEAMKELEEAEERVALLEKEQREKEEELEKTRQDAQEQRDYEDQLSTWNDELGQATAERDEAEKLVRNIEDEVRDLDSELETVTTDIAGAQESLDEKTKNAEAEQGRLEQAQQVLDQARDADYSDVAREAQAEVDTLKGRLKACEEETKQAEQELEKLRTKRSSITQRRKERREALASAKRQYEKKDARVTVISAAKPEPVIRK